MCFERVVAPIAIAMDIAAKLSIPSAIVRLTGILHSRHSRINQVVTFVASEAAENPASVEDSVIELWSFDDQSI